MAATASDPGFINASAGAPAYTANELRQLFALNGQYDGRVFGARAGVRPGGNALQTSIAGSTITVRAGIARVDPGLTTVQGPYAVVNPVDATLTLTAAHATLPRKDITILRVYDHDEDSSGLRQGIVEYIAGTAAGSPSEPAVPSGAIKLATIDVPSVANGSPPAVTINFNYTVSAGGVLPVRSQTERTAITAFDGMEIYRQDRDWFEAYDGSAWRVPSVPVVSSTTDRDSAITNPHTGLVAWLTDQERFTARGASSWTTLLHHRSIRRVQRADGATLATSTSSTHQTIHTVTLTVKPNTTYNVFVRCTAFSSAATDRARLFLHLTTIGGTTLDSSTEETISAASSDVHALWLSYDYTTGGAETSTTFVVGGHRAAGSGTVTFRASTDQPYSFRVTEVDDSGLDSF